MKLTKFITATILALCVQLSYAQSADEYCSDDAELAKSVMSLRQAGIPLRDTLDRNAQIPMESVRKVHYIFIQIAYKQPVYRSAEFRRQAEIDMYNEIYLSCMNIKGKK